MLTITTTNNLDGYEVVEFLNEMSQRAEALGANAVVGANVGYETFAEMIMTTACGTAVRVRRKA